MTDLVNWYHTASKPVALRGHSGGNKPKILVKKLLIGARNMAFSVDGRMPKTLNMLQSLVASAPKVTQSSFECSLLQSMFSLALFALLRIGECTVSKDTN